MSEFLFSTGDCTHWLITTPYAVNGDYYEGAQRSILRSSTSNIPYTASWYNRHGTTEGTRHMGVESYDTCSSSAALLML